MIKGRAHFDIAIPFDNLIAIAKDKIKGYDSLAIKMRDAQFHSFEVDSNSRELKLKFLFEIGDNITN